MPPVRRGAPATCRARLRRSGSSFGVLRACLSRGGAGIELILEDDRRRLAIDSGPPGLPLGAGRWAPRPSPFHRADALFGTMAGQSFITIPDGSDPGLQDRVDPLPRAGRLTPLPARHVDGQADDDLAHLVLVDEAPERGRVAGGIGGALERRERLRAAVGIGERDADPPIAHIQAEDPGHGAAEPASPDADGLAEPAGRAEALLEAPGDVPPDGRGEPVGPDGAAEPTGDPEAD